MRGSAKMQRIGKIHPCPGMIERFRDPSRMF